MRTVVRSSSGRVTDAVASRHLALAGILLLCGTVAIAGPALADGLLFDSERQHCSAIHTVIPLTPEQDREVQRTRLFTPTPEQLAMLRSINPSCPARLQVVTPWYNDCGCGMHGYVLWLRPGEIEVPHGAIGRWSWIDERLIRDDAAAGDTTAVKLLAGFGPEAEAADASILRHAAGSLVMDLDGNLYYDGVSVDTEAILAIVDREITAAAAGDPAHAGAAPDRYVREPQGPVHIWLHMPPLDPRFQPWLFDGLFELSRKLASRGYELALTG